ncbi:MAG TPA: AMP-binding protein [Phycisphaerales bacterium]|nr:AMP-binding protein [Phycisphaerales bacterium]
MSIHWPIIRTCLRYPFERGVADDTRSYRRIELLLAAMNLADVLDRTCKRKGGTVGIMLPSSGAFPIAALAGWISGRVIVPLNFLLKQEELQYVIDDCGCDTVVTATPMLEHLGYTPERVNLLRLDQLNLKRVPEPRVPAWASDDDLALLLYTSGTSGKPKGVMLTHGNITANIRQAVEWVGFAKDEVLLGVLPQFHTFGLTVLTLLPLTRGCRVIYSARFVPNRIVKAFRQHRPTAMIAIPSMYNALLHVKDASADDFKSLRYAVSGGEPLPDAVAGQFFERYGVRIAEGYGLTETSPVTNWCRPHEFKPHSVGQPLPGVLERIVDPESGRALGRNTDGEVRIKGPNVMQGYYRLPKETAAAFDEQGWLKTGDIGRFDDDGHLYITGRLKDMLIIGGENVFPREIEEVLNHHPSVKDSGVVGMKDPMRGEQPVAFVELKEGEVFDKQSIVTFCRGKLAGYKVPEVRHLEALPRNATGKVLRRELRNLVK